MPEILEKLQKTAKKISNGFTQDEQPILYFTDQEILKTFDLNMTPVLSSGNVFLKTYEEVTGFKIESIEALNDFGKNPEAFYKNQFYQANEKDFAHLTKLKLDFASMIQLPDGFNEVVKDWNKFNRSFQNKSAKFFTIENAKLQLTPVAYEDRDRRAYLKATTPEEKERLKIAQDIIKAIEQIEPLLKGEKHMQAAIDEKLYFHPLPFQLKRIRTTEGVKIIPNPSYIADNWGGTAFLGHYILTAAEKRKARRDALPKLGPKWIQFYRPLKIGGKKLFTCPESEAAKHVTEFDEVVPGFFDEAGNRYGEKIDHTKSRTIRETFFNPLNSKK